MHSVRPPVSPNLSRRFPRLSEHVLLTGGAGFIGSHLADRLLAAGHRVRALDNLTAQVHGGARPSYLADDVELVVGDVRDAEAVARALDGVDVVVHLAARVGVGQSMYEIADYVAENSAGTAVLLQALAERPVRKLLVASSMSIYGEGAYDEDGQPVPTPETKEPVLASVYALSKFDQERLCLIFGTAYSVPAVALRLFNVYGTRQALSNPYTGVLAIFASRLLNDRPPLVFEDGLQRRDFVSVHDIARAFELALTGDGADGLALNIGSGDSVTVLEIARGLARVLGKDIEPEVTGQHRVGDIRHCFADISLARQTLDYEPAQRLEDGMREIVEWLPTQNAVDRVEGATDELRSRGLIR
jgi:dTDP-L-rhamnose 4-epimerase